MAEPKPRVKLPKSVAAGVPFTVKTRITHPMHTGLLAKPIFRLRPLRADLGNREGNTCEAVAITERSSENVNRLTRIRSIVKEAA